MSSTPTGPLISAAMAFLEQRYPPFDARIAAAQAARQGMRSCAGLTQLENGRRWLQRH